MNFKSLTMFSVSAALTSSAAGVAFSQEEAQMEPLTLALKYVSFANPENGNPVITEGEAKELVADVNAIYAPCNLRFVLETFMPVNPMERGLKYNLTSLGELNPARVAFEESKQLVVINTGNWDHSGTGVGNAWTTMPGYNPPGAVLEGRVVRNAAIVAHELGHYLSLGHAGVRENLMSPVVYSNSREMTSGQCLEARESAVESWPETRR